MRNRNGDSDGLKMVITENININVKIACSINIFFYLLTSSENIPQLSLGHESEK